MEKPRKKILASGISAGLHSQCTRRHVHSDVCITPHTKIILETLIFSRQHKVHSFINWRDRYLQNELKISKILKFLPQNLNLWLNFEISFSSWFGNKETTGNVLNSLSKCQCFHHSLQPNLWQKSPGWAEHTVDASPLEDWPLQRSPHRVQGTTVCAGGSASTLSPELSPSPFQRRTWGAPKSGHNLSQAQLLRAEPLGHHCKYL